jgi:hypothetical protein
MIGPSLTWHTGNAFFNAVQEISIQLHAEPYLLDCDAVHYDKTFLMFPRSVIKFISG